MSSSVFIESSSQAADTSDYASTADSNLVVVYGKNGISFDDKGLENLIEEKKISSISVIRLTSPTPSMQDEEDEAEKLEEMLRMQEIGSADESYGSEDETNSYSGDDKNDTEENEDPSNEDENEDGKECDNDSNDENKTKQRKLTRHRGRQANVTKQRKTTRRRRRERPEIVGLRLEEFYPPDDANEIIKEALKIAGLGPDKKSKSDYDFQLLVIQNDHCYTPFTSPLQMKAKLAADKLETEKQANRKGNILQSSTAKQLFARKKQIQQNVHVKSESASKTNNSNICMKDKNLAHKLKKESKDRKGIRDDDRTDDNIYSSLDENDDVGDDDDESLLSSSDESAETDNDRDSDLDFDVNNPKGRKRKLKHLKTQKRILVVSKGNPKARRYCSQDETLESMNKPTVTSTLPTFSSSGVQRQKSIKIISDAGRITGRFVPPKIAHMMGPKNILSPAIAALPPIPKKQNESKSLPNTSATTAAAVTPKTYVLVKGPKDQKEIVINKQVMSSPKTKGFTDLTTLIERNEKQATANKFGSPPATLKSSHTATITSVVTLTPTLTAAALKGFMPIDTTAKTQLPAQISVQTHQSSSELEAEHDKQLDLINSIVQDEMQKSNEKADNQMTNINENIPELVKMLESTEKVLVSTNTQNRKITETKMNINNLSVGTTNSSFNKSGASNQSMNLPAATSTVTSSASANNVVGGIDISSASLLATPEGDDTDDLPDDILQQVVELIKDDKTLQEAVEKQVFGADACSDQGIGNNIANQNPPPLALITQQPVRLQETAQTPSKSIIQMAISNVPITMETPISSKINPVITTRTTITTPTTVTLPGQGSKTSPMIRKEPIQIVRGNGRVITLPPIEAPTTRAKRRAQTQPSPTNTTSTGNNASSVLTAAFSESSLDSSMHSNASISAASNTTAVTVQDKKLENNRRRGSKENIIATPSGSNQKSVKTQKTASAKKSASKSTSNKAKAETGAMESEEDDDDDPNKLWCICRQPHNNRFMICCDVCEDWFHGTCVSITKAMGLEMEQKGIDWTCPKCIKKQEEKTQPKITEMLINKRPTAPHNSQTESPHSQVLISSTLTTTPTSVITSVVGPSTSIQNTPSSSNVTNSSIDILNITPKNITTAQNLETKTHLKLQSGQIINLKDYSTTTTKRATIIQTSTSNTGGGITAGQKKLYVTSAQPNLKMTSQSGAPIRTITVVKQLSTPQQQQHQGLTNNKIKIIKTISPAAKTTASPITTSINVSKSVVPVITDSSTFCIVCKKMARPNSIYCSDDCIRKHAQNALNTLMNKSQSDTVSGTINPINKSVTEDKTKRRSKGLFEELLSAADRKPKVERVNVYERKSGRVITGNSAPTTANLKKWLQDNPTFEVIQPGSTQALDLEKKQKLRAQQTSSPTTLKPAPSSPPPLKMFSTSSANMTTTRTDSSSSLQAESSQTQLKSNKSITDYLKSTTSNSTSPRPTTPKQLQKYPQQVGIKIDKVNKTPDDSKAASKEKTSVTKRQSSTENSSKSSNNDGEPIREVVRRTLKEQLLLRIKEETDASSSADSDIKNETVRANNVAKLSEEEVEEFSKSTELEMYHFFNRDTGIKYKAKYRSLVFNIKDRKNRTLFAKICGKLIEPKQLVRMSPEELASQELAQWREQENKHQLEMIKKSELDMLACAKNYVLKTHKGEEVIEGKSSDYASVDITIPVEDVVSALNKSEVSGETAIITTRKDSQIHWPDPDASLLSSHSHMLPESTHSSLDEDKRKVSNTNLKEKDREREREKEKDKERLRGRDRLREKRHKSKDRHHDKSRSLKRSRSHSRSHSRENGEKRHKSSHRDEKRERGDKERIKERWEREHHNEGNDKKASMSETKKSTNVQTRHTGKKHHEQQKASISSLETYNLIDQILESTKTVEEAANLVKERDKEKESENQRKTANTPQPAQTATSTVSTSSSNADSAAIVIDIPANLSSTESDQEPTSTVSIPTPPHDPYSRFISCSSPSSSYAGDLQYSIVSLWTGNINMVDVTSFQLTLQPIVGNSIGLAKLLPKELDVVGRIGPETVWDYISKIKKSPNKEIVVIRLIPASESETVAYKILYEYLDNRNRLGVIKSTSSQIKDFYIYPLGAGKNVPTLLQPTEPVEFYGDPYRPDVLIGIIIRVVISKRTNPISSQPAAGGASSTSVVNKLSIRSNDSDSFTPPGSPKSKKLRQPTVTHKVDEMDIDAIIKAPIAAKSKKVPLTKINDDDANAPYSPGGSSDDELPLLPVKATNTMDPMQAAEEELKRKMEEINRQIAAQEMEIAGLLTGEPTSFGAASASTSNVLASISIPSNLSQILASIKTTGKDQSIVPPPPPLIGSLLPTSSSTNTSKAVADIVGSPNNSAGSSTNGAKNTATESTASSTSLLAKLSEAELLSMVPDDIIINPSKPTRYEEPPPPGV